MRSEYFNSIKRIMKQLGNRNDTIFLGQQVANYAGSFYGSLEDVPENKIREMPITEELQTGIAIGLALEGYLPISIYQRIDFLPRACDQLVNHLDIMKKLTCGKYNPKVLIRTIVGSKEPLDAGLQHTKNLTEGFKKLLSNIDVVEVKTPEAVDLIYNSALEKDKSTIIVEHMKLYDK